jgi:hypothetical protein
MSPGPRNGIGDVDPLADLKPRADRPAVLDQRSQARHWLSPATSMLVAENLSAWSHARGRRHFP